VQGEFNKLQFREMMRGELFRYAKRHLANVLKENEKDQKFHQTILMLKMIETNISTQIKDLKNVNERQLLTQAADATAGGDAARGFEVNSRNNGHGGSSEDEGRGGSGGAGSGSGVGHEAEISLSDIMDELKALRQGQMHELKALREGQTAIEVKIQRVTESVAQRLESISSGGKSEQREQEIPRRSRGSKAATHTHTLSAEVQSRRGASLATSRANAEVNHAVTGAAGRSKDEASELVMLPPMSEFVLGVPEVPYGARTGSRSERNSDAVSVVSRTLSQLIQENKALKQMAVDTPSRPMSAAVPVFIHGPIFLIIGLLLYIIGPSLLRCPSSLMPAHISIKQTCTARSRAYAWCTSI